MLVSLLPSWSFTSLNGSASRSFVHWLCIYLHADSKYVINSKLREIWTPHCTVHSRKSKSGADIFHCSVSIYHKNIKTKKQERKMRKEKRHPKSFESFRMCAAAWAIFHLFQIRSDQISSDLHYWSQGEITCIPSASCILKNRSEI